MKGSAKNESSHQVIRSDLGNGNIYLTVDEAEKKLYWSDAWKKRIEFSSFDGKNRKVFIQTSRSTGPLALVDDFIHWTSEKSITLQWRRKNATGPVKLIKLDTTAIKQNKTEALKVLPITTGSLMKTNSHPCAIDNGGCSDICIADRPESKVCICETGRTFNDELETKCVPRCEARCSSGECIESSMLCDGKADCLDGSDEKCPQKTCENDEFKCENGKCLSKAKRCDKIFDCSDGSDELECPQKGCDFRQFQCQNSTKCIYRSQVCDTNPDCPDGTDETQESCSQKCLDNEFKCLSGQCIPKEFECNYRTDCSDKSDESEQCR